MTHGRVIDPDRDRRIKHRHAGRSVTPAYRAWQNMMTRCFNPKATQYAWYGGRGISVCERWRDFAAFVADVGERPSPKHSLDRIDCNGDYEPGNVRWATHTEQCRNRSSNRSVVRADGARFGSMAEAAESVGGNIRGVHAACNGRIKTHRGFAWSYA